VHPGTVVLNVSEAEGTLRLLWRAFAFGKTRIFPTRMRAMTGHMLTFMLIYTGTGLWTLSLSITLGA
jgi:hypothetical protein